MIDFSVNGPLPWTIRRRMFEVGATREDLRLRAEDLNITGSHNMAIRPARRDYEHVNRQLDAPKNLHQLLRFSKEVFTTKEKRTARGERQWCETVLLGLPEPRGKPVTPDKSKKTPRELEISHLADISTMAKLLDPRKKPDQLVADVVEDMKPLLTADELKALQSRLSNRLHSTSSELLESELMVLLRTAGRLTDGPIQLEHLVVALAKDMNLPIASDDLQALMLAEDDKHGVSSGRISSVVSALITDLEMLKTSDLAVALITATGPGEILENAIRARLSEQPVEDTPQR